MNPTAIQLLVMATADAIKIRNRAAFRTGVIDGFEQGFDLSMGMSYHDTFEGVPPNVSQWEYDLGTYIGACLAVRPS
jgi:hypothetical protein